MHKKLTVDIDPKETLAIPTRPLSPELWNRRTASSHPLTPWGSPILFTSPHFPQDLTKFNGLSETKGDTNGARPFASPLCHC